MTDKAIVLWIPSIPVIELWFSNIYTCIVAWFTSNPQYQGKKYPKV